MARQAQVVGIGPEKLWASPAMRLMTGGTAIPKRSLVEDHLGALKLSLILMAFEADGHRIRTYISRFPRRVRVVAVVAVSLCRCVLDLRALDRVDSFSVAIDAKCFGIGFGKDHFAVLRGLVAGIARFFCVWSVRKFLHQLRPVGLMHGVTGQAIRLFERLPPVGIDEGLIFYVMTAHAQLVWLCAQVQIGFRISRCSLFVNDVTGVASHIKRGMPAPICGVVLPLVVTFEAKVFLTVPGEGFKQMILVWGIVGVMAYGAIPGDRRMQQPLSGSGFLVGMALQAE
jgi:hypothetical protein